MYSSSVSPVRPQIRQSTNMRDKQAFTKLKVADSRVLFQNHLKSEIRKSIVEIISKLFLDKAIGFSIVQAIECLKISGKYNVSTSSLKNYLNNTKSGKEYSIALLQT